MTGIVLNFCVCIVCIGVLIIVLISSAFVKVKVLFSTICKAYAKGWTNGQAKSVLTDIVGLIRAHGLCDCHNDWLNVYVTHFFLHVAHVHPRWMKWEAFTHM